VKVLVTGSRNYTDIKFVRDTLDKLHKEYNFTVLIEGGASGVDYIAGSWANTIKIEHVVVNAEWNIYGRAAGSKRNQKMIDEYRPDMVVAFPGGNGTKDMIERSKKVGIPIIYATHDTI
jgi:hypothetical protein